MSVMAKFNKEADSNIGFWRFVWLCLRKVGSESWTKADTIASAAGAMVGVIIHVVPKLEPVLTKSLWAIPVVAFLCVLGFRLVMSPYWVYTQERDILTKRISTAEHQIASLQQRLTPKLYMPPIVHEQPLGDGAATYYFDVENHSEGETVENVEVKLTSIDPPAIKWLPIPLQIKHDNRPQKTREFNLNPKDKKQIDLVNGGKNSGLFRIVDVVTDIGAWTGIRDGSYSLTVTASGRDTPSVTAVFQVWRDETGYLRCKAM
jgi:hypothetical protein